MNIILNTLLSSPGQSYLNTKASYILIQWIIQNYEWNESNQDILINLYEIQIKVSKINLIKMSVIMMIIWYSISYLDHSTFLCRTILLPLKNLEYISYQNQGQVKVIKIKIIKIKRIKINFEMSHMKLIKIMWSSSMRFRSKWAKSM